MFDLLSSEIVLNMKRDRETFDNRDCTELSFLPIRNPLLEAFYQEQKNCFWTVSEIDFSNDRTSWDQLDLNTKIYTTFILSLFAQLDGIVIENLVENFERETSVYAKECSMFYAIQNAMEWGHNETYSFLISAFIRDPDEKERCLNSIKNNPSVRKIADWTFNWMDPSKPLLERIIAFICIEGILFSSAFAGIYFLKRRNVLPGLCKANEWIARDEAIHTRFGISLYHHLTKIWKKIDLLTEVKIHEIISSAVDITSDFTRNAMECKLVGIDAEDMISYVQATADTLCSGLGYKPIYKTPNRLDWMLLIALPNKGNFFETKISEYAREDAEEQFVFDLKTPF